MESSMKPSPRTGNVPEGRMRSPRQRASFLSRLRTAWLVLIGRIDPDAITKAQTVLNMPLNVVHTSMSPVRLRSSWWVHGPDLTHARDMVRRELCDAAAPYILYQDLPTEDGGYQVTSELLICKETHP